MQCRLAKMNAGRRTPCFFPRDSSSFPKGSLTAGLKRVLKKSGFAFPEGGRGFSRANKSLQINAPLGAEAFSMVRTLKRPPTPGPEGLIALHATLKTFANT